MYEIQIPIRNVKRLTLLTDRSSILSCSSEHFQALITRTTMSRN